MAQKTQHIEFWNSQESIERYADIEMKLYDVESAFLTQASVMLGKSVDQIKVLDLGCGGGRTTIPLHRMGYDVTGIDIAENLIHHLKEKYPDVKAFVGDASKLDFKDESFDIVIFSHNSLDCLDPYSLRDQCLREIGRVLKNGGIFIFSSHVFNLIPYNGEILNNLIKNRDRIPTILSKGEGYYKDHMKNGDIVELYSTTIPNMRKHLLQYNMHIQQHSRIINTYPSLILTFLKAILGWERYYLVQKQIT